MKKAALASEEARSEESALAEYAEITDTMTGATTFAPNTALQILSKYYQIEGNPNIAQILARLNQGKV